MARVQKTDVVAVSVGSATNALLLEITKRELEARRPDAVEKAEGFRDRCYEFYRECMKAADLARRREERDNTPPAADEFGERRKLKSERNEALATDALATAKALADLLKHYAPKINNHRPAIEGATSLSQIQNEARKRGDPLLRMKESREIDDAMLSAAGDIKFIFEQATKSVASKTGSFFKSGGGGKYEFMSDAVADRHSRCYLPWARDLHKHKTLNLPCIMDIVIDGMSLAEARKTHRHSHAIVKRMTIAGLEMYAIRYAAWQTSWAEKEAYQ